MARILLVDDDIAEISAVKRVLARAGHQAVLATNASDALAVIAQATPALALVAATCEGGEALALAHRLAAGDGTPPLPLLLLGTAEAGPEGAVQLARPVDPGQLAEEVIAALARAIRAAPAPRLAASPVARASVPGVSGGRGSATAVPSRTANTSGAGHPERGAAPGGAESKNGAPTTERSRGATATAVRRPTSTMQPERSREPTPTAIELPGAVHPERSDAAPAAARSRGTTPTQTATQTATQTQTQTATATRAAMTTGAAGAGHPERSDAASAAERSRGTPTRTAAATAPPPTDARRAAAEALLARANELRRTSPPASSTVEAEDDGLEALLRRAEEAERLHLAERKARTRQADRATVEAAQRAEAERVAVEKAGRARDAEARARAGEVARADAEAHRREEEARRADAERRAAAEAARRAEAEARARREAESAQRAAAEAARRRAEAETRAAEATRRAQAEKHEAEEAARRAEDQKHEAEEAARRAEEEKREAEEAARRAEEEKRDAEEAARRAEAETRTAAESARRAEVETRAAEEAARRAEAETRDAAEAARRSDAQRREAEERARRAAEDEAHRARHADEKAASEADARRRLEAELERLRLQLDDERRTAEQRIQSVLERAAAEEQAAEELRRIADEEAQREAEAADRRREQEEENLRRAIESARAEMETLRRRTEEEARRREEAEAELRRMAEDAARVPVAFPFPDDVVIAPRPAPAEDSEDAARRRVAALRGRELDEDPTLPSTAAWLGTVTPGVEQQEAVHPERSDAASAAERSRRTPPELRSGTLSDLPAPRLLALAARARLTGRIDVQGEAARSVYLEDGRIVGATSSDPADRVEELALRFGLLTRDQHRQLAAAAAALPSRRAALLLLERGFLKPTELTGLVRRRAEEVVFGLFSEPAARFRWAGAAVPADERISLERDTLAIAIEGVRRRWLAPRVDEVLGGAGTLLVPGDAAPSAAELGLSPAERRLVALADGLRTVDEIVSASALDILSTRQVLAGLVLVDALRVRLLLGGRPALAATAAIDLARVHEKLDHVRRADYFTVLGLGRLCTPHEAREAAGRLLAEFALARHAGLREEGLPGALDEILRVVADAREVLADDRLRAEYLGALAE